MKNPLLELYSDFLISSFGPTTATALSRLVDFEVSHDQITRFLSGTDYTSRDLWSLVKTTVRAVETDDGVLIFDDTVEEKPYSDENEIIALALRPLRKPHGQGREHPQLPVSCERGQHPGGV
jgi:hypothetical protein